MPKFVNHDDFGRPPGLARGPDLLAKRPDPVQNRYAGNARNPSDGSKPHAFQNTNATLAARRLAGIILTASFAFPPLSAIRKAILDPLRNAKLQKSRLIPHQSMASGRFDGFVLING